MQEFEEKAKDYLAARVPRVWVIDPEVIVMRGSLELTVIFLSN